MDIKSYHRGLSRLKINTAYLPDWYVVFRGLLDGTAAVYAFNGRRLVNDLKKQETPIHPVHATSISQNLWDKARVPQPKRLDDWNLRVLLGLF